MKLKELPSSWTAALSRLLDSTHPNVRIRTAELIRSRALPGFDGQLERIASDGAAPDPLRATALDALVVQTSKADKRSVCVSYIAPEPQIRRDPAPDRGPHHWAIHS